MNYMDEIALAIYHRVEGMGPAPDIPDPDDMALYRIYAVLALATGTATTNEHVHDAWSAWTAGLRPGHFSLVPFDQLAPDVQELDTPYRDAIRAVASEEAA